VPLPVKDKIIVGASGGDNGVRDYILAADAATGKVRWRKYTIPAMALRPMMCAAWRSTTSRDGGLSGIG
jgi:alcohol dehydrogenase (cytochrome c)